MTIMISGELTLRNRRLPVNITNHYGKIHGIKFRLFNTPTAVYSPKEQLTLVGFNTFNKYNGFYRQRLDKNHNPEQLLMGPYYFYAEDSQGGGISSVVPFKASLSEKWVVMRQSSDDAPNFFLTNNFKDYTRLTNIQPQRGIQLVNHRTS